MILKTVCFHSQNLLYLPSNICPLIVFKNINSEKNTENKIFIWNQKSDKIKIKSWLKPHGSQLKQHNYVDLAEINNETEIVRNISLFKIVSKSFFFKTWL